MLDSKLFFLINHLRSNFLDTLLPWISVPGHLYLIYGILVLFFLFKKPFKDFLIFLTILVIGFSVADFTCARVVKPFFKRERPFKVLHGVFYPEGKGFVLLKKPLKKCTSYSFPSCHATNVSYTSFFMGFNYPLLFPVLLSIMLLVGWSRIYLGVHYPFDVLGGYVLGFLIAFIFYEVYIFLRKKLLI